MTEVVAALICQGDRFMICQRPAHKARGLLWEFVGGKVESGETKEQALIRECKEELAVTLLVASHIKPWTVCTNEERLSAENGLLLSPTFDKLFDCGLISFVDTGRIIISSQLSKEVISKLHISATDIFDLKASSDLKKNLEYHRDVVFATQGRTANG